MMAPHQLSVEEALDIVCGQGLRLQLEVVQNPASEFWEALILDSDGRTVDSSEYETKGQAMAFVDMVAAQLQTSQTC